MDIIIKLNSQTAGRDKIVRLLQYASKLAWHSMQQQKLSHQSVDRLKNLEYTFSSFRKLLRLGRCLDVLYGALSSIHYPDLALRVTLTLSKIANALYLLADHILWFGRTGLVTVDGDRWNRVANKYWLYSITMNLVRDVYEIMRILNRRGRRQKTINVVLEHREIVIDTLKNGCDVLIPLAALGYVRLNAGVIGLLGVISSLAAIVSLVDPLSRLTPS